MRKEIEANQKVQYHKQCPHITVQEIFSDYIIQSIHPITQVLFKKEIEQLTLYSYFSPVLTLSSLPAAVASMHIF